MNEPYAETLREKLFSWQEARRRLKSLHDHWDLERKETNRRRVVRDINVSPKQLREEGKLKSDETLTPIRTIDTNIAREMPSYVQYLVGSDRLAVFTDSQDPSLDTQNLEKSFSRGLRYTNWQIPHFKTLLGSATHGYDALEVVYDPSKPAGIVLEHVGHDKLFFAVEAIDLEACEVVIRTYSTSQLQLRNFVEKFGFSKKQVDELLSKKENREDDIVSVHKCYFKFDGIVYVAWFSFECDEWLKNPIKFFNGRRSKITDEMGIVSYVDEPETEYPIFVLTYREEEEDQILSHKGRVFLDEHTQEAQTAILSGYVNGLMRASNVYGSVTNMDSSPSNPPKIVNMRLEHGGIYDKNVAFWNTGYPDPSILSGLQYIDVAKSNETSQVNFAINNRKDSRKTATEIEAANQQAAALSTVQVSLYSTFLCRVYTYCWKLVQNLAINGEIEFLSVPVGTGIDGKPVFKNNVELIGRTYILTPAGDIDVVKRAEKIQRMKQDWPVFANIPVLNMAFLSELIRLSYPDVAEKWIPLLQMEDSKKTSIRQLLGLLAPHLQEANQLDPQQQQQVQQILNTAQQLSQ